MASSRAGLRPVRLAAIMLAASAAAIISTGGCGSVGFAPDALVESPQADAFLNRVAKDCGRLRIGDQTVAYLLDVNNSDTYFVDETTKLFFGDVSGEQYASDINAFYPTDANRPAIECVFAHLPG
jgi:hypothetical protein